MFTKLHLTLIRMPATPSRAHEIARYGVKAVLAGTLANLMSASIAGFFLALAALC